MRMERTGFPLPLLEFLAYRAGCVYLSDLHNASSWQKARLVRELEGMPAEAVTLCEWNDALAYLAQAPPEGTAEAARKRLLCALSADLGKE